MSEPVDDAEPPGRRRLALPTRMGKPRSVPQTYHVEAVRRPSRPGSRAAAERSDEPVAPSPVADEEIVDALLRGGEPFAARLTDRLNEQLEPGEWVVVTIGDVRPGGSVLLKLLFAVQSARNALDIVSGFTAAVMLEVAALLDATLGEPVAVSVAPEAPAVAEAGAATPRTGWEVISPVLAAVGTGIGVIGFVTFVGGVYVWARLNGNGFPAAPALSVFPKQDLLVVGASTLVPQLLVALLIVVVLSGIYLIVRRASRNVGEVERLLLAGEASALSAIGMGLFVALALGATVVLTAGGLEGKDAKLAFVAVGLGGLIGAMVGYATRRFVYLATTSFLVVAVFMGFLAYVRARDDKQVRGAAIIRAGQTPVTGVYLTEGAGRVYLAQIKLDAEDKIVKSYSHIVAVDKSEVSDLAIAGAQLPKQALADAAALKAELCGFQPMLEKPTPGACGPTPTPTTTPVPPKPPAIPVYAGGARTLDAGGTVLFVLPAMKEDAIGVVTFITRKPIRVDGARPRQISLATKPFRGQAGHPIRVQLRLSVRARRALRTAGGAMPVTIRIVAVGATGLASRDGSGCVVLRAAAARAAAKC